MKLHPHFKSLFAAFFFLFGYAMTAWADTALSFSSFAITPGETKRVAIGFNSDQTFTACQMDIFLPEGLSIPVLDDQYAFFGSSRLSSSHMIMSNLLRSGAVRVVVYSMSSSPFSGQEGDFLYMDIAAAQSYKTSSSIRIENVRFTSTQVQEFVLPSVSATAYRLTKVTAVANDSCVWNGKTYTATGVYYDTLRTVSGQDSILMLSLTVANYTIRFVNYDGAILQSGLVPSGTLPQYVGAQPQRPSTAQHTFTFSGWSPAVSEATRTCDYVAQYDSVVNSYVVTFADEDGTTLQTSEVEYGQVPAYNGATPTKPATAQYTYTFIGWDKEIVSVVGTETYTAQFDSVVNKYTITFLDENGTILQTSEVEYGQVPAYNGATPTKPSTGEFTYTFAGWSPEVVSVTGNATYTATYTNSTNGYLIQFVNYDGATLQSGVVNYGVTPIYNGATPTRPATAQYTYTFKGWSPAIASVTDAATYTAQFDSVVNKYTITFVDEDGTILQTSDVEYGQVPAYNGATPSKPSTGEFTYAFAGWSPEVVSVTGNATYTATYSSTVNKYTITFVDEDGTVLQTSEVEYGQVPAYNGATPSKAATAEYTYTFAGWTPEIVAITGDATYTATYSSVVNQYTITVSGENCTITGGGTYDYGTEITLTVTPDEGYQFVAWSDGNTESSRQITVTEDATYTAILEKIETGWEENVLKEKGRVIFDGHHYYILRDGQIYDATGRMVD